MGVVCSECRTAASRTSAVIGFVATGANQRANRTGSVPSRSTSGCHSNPAQASRAAVRLMMTNVAVSCRTTPSWKTFVLLVTLHRICWDPHLEREWVCTIL